MSGEQGSLSKVAVALDTSDWDEFQRWARFFGGRVGVLKVGLEAYVKWGPRAVEVAASGSSSVFLDLKLHDIPNTVAGAVRSVRSLGVRYLTLHASGGRAALAAAVGEAGDELNLLAVTVLTHLDESALSELGLPGSPGERVETWAALASAAGCQGIVCSPLELARLRRDLPSPFLLVAPGIRPALASGSDDQRRTATPSAAISDGADLLVIGRPLTRSADPEAALDALARELAESEQR